MTQSEALRILKTGANVFLTGEPGSGKTHTVNQYVSFLHSCGISPAITASTGIAATHVGGMTIHSWSGIGIRSFLSAYDLDTIASNKRVVDRVSKAKVLIIDEVSMLSANTLEMVDAVCREVRRRSDSFGGLQVVFVGDFFQLPPIVRKETVLENSNEEMFEFIEGQEKPSKNFAFGSSSWQRANPIVCYLSEQHRQDDKTFLDFLGAVRRGEIEEFHHELLKERFSKVSSKGGITELYSHNADVDRINDLELAKLSGEPTFFRMQGTGPERVVLGLKKSCLSPENLKLKIGARVMFTKNDVSGGRFVNGTLGTISGFAKESHHPLVQTFQGRTIEAEPTEWRVEDGRRIIAKVTQIPLRLAWAITVHKSQGLSLDSAHMDLSNCFEYGQGYVALSRVRSFAGLSLAGINARALEVHPEIKERDEYFRAASKVARSKFESIPVVEIEKMHSDFVRAIGGVPGKKIEKTISHNKRGQVGTLDITLDLVLQKMLVAQIAKKRGITMGTVFSHLEELKKGEKLVADRDLSHLKIESVRFSKIKKTFEEIFKKTGEMKLAPVRDLLGESFSFDELRTARLFL